MKAVLSACLLLLSGSVFASNVELKNQQIESCVQKTEAFLRNVQFDVMYYHGQNSLGKCFIGYVPTTGKAFSLFVNSRGTTHTAGVEISKIDPRSPTRITNDIQQCDMTATSLVVRNKYRMPKTIYFHGNGGMSTSWPIFDSVENQTVIMKKDARGSLRSVSVESKNGGLQTCYF